jgi:dipeptidyl aminopeptidase/acylaminoacyl peptidase
MNEIWFPVPRKDPRGRRARRARSPILWLLAAGTAVLLLSGASAAASTWTPQEARDQETLSRSVARTLSDPGEVRRPLKIEDYYRIRTIGSLRVSPDGEWVAYTLSTPVEATNEDVVETWVARTDASSDPFQIRHEGDHVSSPAWQDDGRLRYRHGERTWLAHLARPDAAPEGVEEPEGLESPDGLWRASTRNVARAGRPGPELTEFERRHEERFEGVSFDWYPFMWDGQDFPLPDPAETPAVEVFIEATDGSGEARQLTSLGLEVSEVRWAPEGNVLLFSVDEGLLDELAYGAADLFLVTVDGDLTRLTEDGYDYTGAEFSPDGTSLAYVRSYGTDMIIEDGLDHGGPRDLYVHPLGGGEPVNLTADWDLDAGNPLWSPGGNYIYFSAGIGGAVHLFRVSSRGGEVEQVTTGERRIQNVDIDRAFRRITYTVGEFDAPPDVWVADIDGENERRLTDLHEDLLAEIDVATRASRAVHWESYDGTSIEGFLLFPHNHDPEGGPYPLIVVNHGGPHSASGYGFNFKNQLFTAHGYFVFLPNFRASTGYGVDFKWATWGGWGNKDGEDVLSGIDYLISEYGVDPDRVGSTGHSYGGILTNWLITRYPERFRAAVSGAGESNWTSNYALSDRAETKDKEFFGPPWEDRSREIMIRQSPFLNCGGVQTPTLFVHGAVDYRVPLSGALQLYTCLKRHAVPTQLIIYEGMAHGIRGHWNNIHRMMHEMRWWDTYLKPERLPSVLGDGGS